MIYNAISIKNKFKDYQNIGQKVNLEIKNGKLKRIKRGVYSDNVSYDAPLLANYIYSPSYISFEYALSYYGLIPEYVSVFTCATFGKKNNKSFETGEVAFQYYSIPKEVFCYGVSLLKNEDGFFYKIATKEKALLDQLYLKYPVRSIKDLTYLLFEDLRIDEDELKNIDKQFIFDIGPLYHCSTIDVFIKFLKRG